MLCGDERNPGIHERLLGIEHIERRPLSDPCLFPHAVEGQFRRRHLGLCRFDLAFRSLHGAPGLHDGLPDLIPDDVQLQAGLPKGFLGLADQGIFGSTLVNRNRQ